MLTTLRIKNLALVSDLTLELQPGYNAITGETGAGKSVLLGALNLVLGERADRTLIRAGSDACAVEAVFQVPKLRARLKAFLEENGIEPSDHDGQLLLKRTFSASGVNRQFLNGSPTTLQVLGTIGQWLVDIHGPHDHQSLLQPARQLDMLDAFGGFQPLRDRFAELLHQKKILEAQKAELIVDEKTFAQQLDLLRFQSNEIKAAKLQPGEEPELEEEFRRASNAARLLRLTQVVLGILSEEEPSVLQQARLLGRTLHELQSTDPGAAHLVNLHEQAVLALQELQTETSAYADKLEIDPLRYHELEERIDLVQALKRKYGSTLAEIIAFGEAARQKLIQLEQRDVQLIRINDQLAQSESELRRAGDELSAQRRKLLPKFGRAVMKQLTDLGFKQSHFDVICQSQATAASPSVTGFDTIEFQFAPNPGEPPRALRAIASSGELARVMLALKTVLAAEDDVPVLVFDEVDANVGGETAHAVGDKMCQIARQRQVLCITHLAPVAASADAHFVVTKQTDGGRTVSQIQLLDRSGRVTELARMLGGQSAAARKHAEELLK